jgi:hypothetical protein
MGVLKRATRSSRWLAIRAPIQGLVCVGGWFPGRRVALPWATLECPFGASEQKDSEQQLSLSLRADALADSFETFAGLGDD